MDTIKYTVNLETLPDDTKGYEIVSSTNTKKPYKVEGVLEVDVDAILQKLEYTDVMELAKRTYIIDIQRDERSKVLTTLGFSTTREPKVKTSDVLLRLKDSLKRGIIDQSQYDNLAGMYK